MLCEIMLSEMLSAKSMLSEINQSKQKKTTKHHELFHFMYMWHELMYTNYSEQGDPKAKKGRLQ